MSTADARPIEERLKDLATGRLEEGDAWVPEWLSETATLALTALRFARSTEPIAQLAHLWNEQAAFNRLLRPLPTDERTRMEQTREIVLHLESELHELLATYSWKFHRNKPQALNTAQREEEMADIFKFMLTLAEIQGMTPQSLVEAFHRKSAVVKQRYDQEWVHRVDRPYVVIDIDGVLCDYAGGFSAWLCEHRPDECDWQTRLEVLSRHQWLDAHALRISDETWRTEQHNARVAGAKRCYPTFPDAVGFTKWCHECGWMVILLTSRPIDRYPNIYTDTVYWLRDKGFAFDIVWWAQHKGDFMALQQLPKGQFRFYVDDDLTFVRQVAMSGYTPCFWLRRGISKPDVLDIGEYIRIVQSLDDIRKIDPKEVL